MNKINIQNLIHRNGMSDTVRILALAEIMNEIIEWINSQPKKLEVKHENRVCFIENIDEWMVIEKCLKYCRHRMEAHGDYVGIKKALSKEDIRIFYKLIEKI